MAHDESSTVRIKVSPEVARIVKTGAPRDAQIAAARGALPLGGKDLLTVLFFLCSSRDVDIRKNAVKTLRELPVAVLTPALNDKALHPQLLDLLIRAKINDVELMAMVIMHPATPVKSLVSLASKAENQVLERLAGHQNLLYEHPEIVEAIIANEKADKSLKYRLGWQEPVEDDAGEENLEHESSGQEEDPGENDGRSQTEIEALMEEVDEKNLSKYQIALELKVAEKIKMGLTGDKEWRTILIKDANKLVQGAVMKNPRITDGEVVMVAKNKTSSDELIRLILLNKDWMKLYEIKKALVVHPKTPPPKAMRLIPFLTLKDIKDLAKSRQVSTLISTTARKELELRQKKAGG